MSKTNDLNNTSTSNIYAEISHPYPSIQQVHSLIAQSMVAGICDVTFKSRMQAAVAQYLNIILNEFPKVIKTPRDCSILSSNLLRSTEHIIKASIASAKKFDQKYLSCVGDCVSFYISSELGSVKMFKLEAQTIAYSVNNILNILNLFKKLINQCQPIIEVPHYILRVLITIPKFFCQKEIMAKVFSNVMPLVDVFEQEELPDNVYMQYLLVYYRWLSLYTDTVERERIIDIADKLMRPNATLIDNVLYAELLPKFVARRTATRYILENLKSYNLLRLLCMKDNDMCYTFLESESDAHIITATNATQYENPILSSNTNISLDDRPDFDDDSAVETTQNANSGEINNFVTVEQLIVDENENNFNVEKCQNVKTDNNNNTTMQQENVATATLGIDLVTSNVNAAISKPKHLDTSAFELSSSLSKLRKNLLLDCSKLLLLPSSNSLLTHQISKELLEKAVQTDVKSSTQILYLQPNLDTTETTDEFYNHDANNLDDDTMHYSTSTSTSFQLMDGIPTYKSQRNIQKDSTIALYSTSSTITTTTTNTSRTMTESSDSIATTTGATKQQQQQDVPVQPRYSRNLNKINFTKYKEADLAYLNRLIKKQRFDLVLREQERNRRRQMELLEEQKRLSDKVEREYRRAEAAALQEANRLSLNGKTVLTNSGQQIKIKHLHKNTDDKPLQMNGAIPATNFSNVWPVDLLTNCNPCNTKSIRKRVHFIEYKNSASETERSYEYYRNERNRNRMMSTNDYKEEEITEAPSVSGQRTYRRG